VDLFFLQNALDIIKRFQIFKLHIFKNKCFITTSLEYIQVDLFFLQNALDIIIRFQIFKLHIFKNKQVFHNN
jgi:hypothetical protein